MTTRRKPTTLFTDPTALLYLSRLEQIRYLLHLTTLLCLEEAQSRNPMRSRATERPPRRRSRHARS